MKRFVVIVLAVLLIFGIVASIVSSTQKAQQAEAPAPTDAAAPTPGNTTRAAPRTVSASDVTTVSTPMASNASLTLVRFPAL